MFSVSAFYWARTATEYMHTMIRAFKAYLGGPCFWATTFEGGNFLVLLIFNVKKNHVKI